jgi:hypothetical protein
MKRRAALVLIFLLAGPVFAQSGLRVPPHADEPGLDPTFARGWLAPDYDRYGTALHNWREAVGFAPGQRMNWSYNLNDRGSLGMSMANSRDFDDQRQMSLYGRYWFTPDWALGVETLSRDPSGLFLLRDFRIGVQRRF